MAIPESIEAVATDIAAVICSACAAQKKRRAWVMGGSFGVVLADTPFPAHQK